jgi:cytochrome c-type biogenesis protein CcmH
MIWQPARRALRRPSNLIAAIVFVAVGVFWAAGAIQSARAQTLDQRVHDVASQIQCPACNGESVADSPSAIALSMRGVIRQKLSEGVSEQEVLDYFQQRYGAGILESPPKQGFTSLIWLAPVLMFLAGIVVLGSVGREWRVARVAADLRPDDVSLDADLSDRERERYRRLLQRELDADEGLPVHRVNETEGR